ncbi:MAG: aminopeptidase [Treponema sp.]|jgi:predicted aminopeptidase|nr:aminopeptidase [Treponema sp.]
MKIIIPLLPVFAVLGILLVVLIPFSGCYTLSQGVIMLGYLNRAVSLDDLLIDAEEISSGESADSDNVSEYEKRRIFVERIRDIRRFAMEELGLKESANYTKYVELDRNYLAAVVSASAKDAFIRYEWWFPVVGKVPYKGFFMPDDARKEADKLKKKELDVWIRSVDAFSTLGWFQDPLYSFMQEYTAAQLADLVIHELLHATVFLKGQVQFNEELAEFVGSEGARIYIEKTFGIESKEYQQMQNIEADSSAYIAFIQGLISQLDSVYKSNIPREEKLQQKDAIIRASQERFTAEYESLFLSDNYRGFSKLPINNAYLELFRLYYDGKAHYKELYERYGSDLPRFINAAKTLKNKGDPKRQLEDALSRSSELVSDSNFPKGVFADSDIKREVGWIP